MNERFFTSLKISRKLKEAGLRQSGGEVYWARCRSFMEYMIVSTEEMDEWKCVNSKIRALSVGELGELLPDIYYSLYIPNTSKFMDGKSGWAICNAGYSIFDICADTEANARGLMLLHLHDRGIINLGEIG